MDDAPLTRAQSQARTREDLLDAAQEVFAARGFHGASVADVAKAAHRTKGAVYANFAGKEELFLAVLDRHIARASGSGPDRPEPFDRVWGLLALEAVLYAVREAPDLLREFAERYRRVDELNADRLRAHGAAPADRVEALAIARSALGEGLMIRHLVEPGRVDRDVVARVFDLVLEPPEPGERLP